ncbi:MAG: hypothetical protein HKN57_06255 [Xanthomonadales bacterium]|nr:hypothetical protein [Gammaproteobacteria bacterium]MBT8053244.1 hypothetical protein [Gammaproteobacteria bacterium]NND56836.1 hypothetical protein [Xanthomonadales bacterium]NNK50284.1 hypothetical protein [Xanthomonadales bacterium]
MNLKNKHLMTAMLVAPVLALISYFAIDAWVGESPHAAREGQSYSLVEKPNCRYNSGACGLKNGDFELVLVPEPGNGGRLVLELKSEFPLDGVVLALVDQETGERPPEEMGPVDDSGLVWSLDLERPDPEKSRLRLVASSRQALWYGDTSLKFTQPANPD